MSRLDEPKARPDDSDGEDPTEATVTVAETGLSISVPADATASQTAAIVSAIGAHVTDRQRAAVAAAAEADDTETTDEWTLAARLSRFGKRRRPRDVARGDEWKAAARAQY